jgi:hypothetical protein
MRCGLLIVLAGIAPIALALHGTPQTEGAAKLWWRAMLGATGTVVIQAAALHTTLTIFLSPDANLPVLGLIVIPDAGATMNLLIVACLLFGILKVPGLMRRFVTQTKPGVSGQIFRLVVIQQLTRGLSRAFGGVSSAHRATTAGKHATTAGQTVADPPWPTISPRGGGRSVPPSPTTRPGGAVRPLPRPAGAAPGRVGVASGRPIRPYTPEELANGVDLYTRALKARGAASTTRGRTTP